MIDKIKYKVALDFAYKLHFKQIRKGTEIPYFSHLISVSNNVIENGGNTDEAIAGLLHDAVEDQGGLKTLKIIKKKFGSKVAKIVREENRPLLIFPQGTRVKLNERIPFKKGVGRIYETLNISCVPVALNSGKVWPKEGLIKYPGKITASFLKPIEPGLNKDEFIKNLEIKIYDEIKNIS